ncbi:hypothetical protein CAPTEDRAFT_107307 [Capitella teleta]|uniref:ABC transporter domain-containing protein n=1 Tax=Capitella teleta TaxID=283909 RepID=R7VBZ2_CAPTE|nr:hypothetical protein CAPTEDRAFT_107307 [Capitella teleta]|eukprot:ELU13831.1 hypothetical protein CAPTEDRAFT_107307 [Capitella teleta]
MSTYRGISKAWVSQQTWLMNATLRDNILFTKKHDSSLYDEVIECCALKHDINALAAGDLTEIGENGLNLSGGQQQRVNIGRALYSNADVVLMDDPLSALDAHVRYQVFHHAIQEFLIRKHKRTVVAVMHDAQYTQHADWVIMMKEGRVSYEGTWNGAHHISALNRKNQLMRLFVFQLYEPKISEVCFASRSMSSIDSFIQSTEMLSENNEEEGLTEKEEQKTGSVSWRVYFSYSQSAGHVLVFLSIALYLTHQSLQMVADFWLSDWMEAEHATGSVHTNSTLHSQTSSEIKLIMWGYVAFQLSAVLILFFSILMIEIMALRAAYNFHANMLSALLKAPLRFFDCTPLGRILNRFSSDTNIIDKLLVTNMDHVLYNTLHVIGGIIVNGISNSFFLLPLAPIFCAFVFIQRFYLTSCRELQRLNNITKSPILSNFSETLNGLPTIRAYGYGVQKWFLDKHFSLVDVNLTVFLYLKTAAIWLGIRFGYLGALIVFSACVCSISAGINGSISPSVVGLAIAYAIITTSLLIIMMRGISEMEMLFNSVERVSLYIATPPEKERGHSEFFSTDQYWPTSGDIEFKDLCARYDQNLKPVLKNVNLTIKSGEKIGICGRTGSGKSSLTLCLFQMIEVHQGHLLIDGVDISTLPLGLLRKRIAIIPQDPVLFHGSIRHNLDPSSSRTDIELWTALHSAQLQGTIKAFPLGLDTIVAESGVNLSVGQRQLFCLARAILSNSRILILDEATSSVDMATDALIQKVIQSSFAQSTVISIAHRVRTLEHCNRIVVMSDGRIAEEGQPSELKNSAFARLMQ